MSPVRLLATFLAVAVAYVALSYAAFKVPATLAEAEICGFVADDFNAAGQLSYPPAEAWWVSFNRQQEYWSTLSIALALTFVAYAIHAARRIGSGVAAGAAMGGSVLAMSALCLSCLAPALSVVGLGLTGALLAGVPKWLIAFNTLVLTVWGGLFVSRRLAACPLPSGKSSAAPA